MSTRELAKKIRINSLKMVNKASASHIGSALSIADIVSVLYGEIMKFDSSDINEDRDRFILSKGHACVAVYSVLAEMGFFPKKSKEASSRNRPRWGRQIKFVEHNDPSLFG